MMLLPRESKEEKIVKQMDERIEKSSNALAAKLLWLMVALQGWSSGVWSFCIFRTLAYFVAGGMQPVLLKLMSSVTPQEQRGSAFGFSTCFLCIGGMFSAIFAGWSMMLFSVNGVFYTGAILFWLLIPVYITPVLRVEKAAKRRC